MKEGDEVIIDNKIYIYDEFYDRLELKTDKLKEVNHIACPKCHNILFTISYASYQCIANCKCGHSMTVYDG